MATYPVYPATTFTQAVELTIFASNQLHDVINGDALTTVETENGDVPTLRKALVDNFYFKTPINWVEGESSTVFNQLYYFEGTIATSGWYYAPQATVDNPVAMGSTPLNDDNWRLYQTAKQSIPAQVYPWSMDITTTITSVAPPYEFDTAIVTLNGTVLVPGDDRDYTIANSIITFNFPIVPQPDLDYTDVLFCYLGKVEEGNAETNYITYENLAKNTAANLIGTSYGISVEEALDPMLRQNMGSVDGFKLIGRCPDIASLRKTKPLYHGQSIILHKAIENGPDVNVVLSYDALDTTSSDDDCAIFVTEDGARWKYDLSNGYNTSLAGYNPTENNMAAVVNKITAVITDNVIAAGKILGIPTTIALPNYQDNTHIMDEELVIPPFVSLRANTQHVFKFSNDSYGIKICTDFNSALSWSVVTNGFPSGNGDSGYKIYEGPRLIIMGLGRDSSTKAGILIGNKTNNSNAPVRDIDVAGIYVSGFKSALEYGNYNTYNTFATNIHGEQNQYGLFTDDTSTQSNSGETHVLRDCTLSQNSKAHCHLGTRNVYFDLYSCHLDYAPNVFEFGEFAWWVRVTTYGGWFEGFENLAEAMGTGFTGAPELNMINPIIDARGYYESTWGGPRKIFKTTAGGKSKTLYVNLTDPKISFPKKPAYPSSLLSGLVTGYPTGDVTNSNIGIKTSYTKYKADAGYYPYPYLGHSSESLCGSSFAVGTPTGSPITNNFRGLEFRTSGSGTVVLVAADANYANQLSFDVTLTSASDYVDVTSLARIKLEYNDIVAATISVMPKEATGAINVAPALYHYSADKVVSTLLADNTIKNSISRNLIETTAPDVSAYTNVLSYLSDTGTPATRNSFIGSQPTLAAMRNVWVYGDYTTEGQYEYSNLAIRLTGFVGTIRVMLPLWWKV